MFIDSLLRLLREHRQLRPYGSGAEVTGCACGADLYGVDAWEAHVSSVASEEAS